MRDDRKSTWWLFYEALLAGRAEEDLDLSLIQVLVQKAKEQDAAAQHKAERVALEEAQAKFYKPNWHGEVLDL
jgi:hypothetical protein